MLVVECVEVVGEFEQVGGDVIGVVLFACFCYGLGEV